MPIPYHSLAISHCLPFSKKDCIFISMLYSCIPFSLQVPSLLFLASRIHIQQIPTHLQNFLSPILRNHLLFSLQTYVLSQMTPHLLTSWPPSLNCEPPDTGDTQWSCLYPQSLTQVLAPCQCTGIVEKWTERRLNKLMKEFLLTLIQRLPFLGKSSVTKRHWSVYINNSNANDTWALNPQGHTYLSPNSVT